MPQHVAVACNQDTECAGSAGASPCGDGDQLLPLPRGQGAFSMRPSFFSSASSAAGADCGGKAASGAERSDGSGGGGQFTDAMHAASDMEPVLMESHRGPLKNNSAFKHALAGQRDGQLVPPVAVWQLYSASRDDRKIDYHAQVRQPVMLP